MKRALVLIGGLLLLVAVAFYCVGTNTHVIQQDISSRLTDTFIDQRINWAKVTVDGRDVTLGGEAPSEKEMRYALDLAESLDGTRVVYNRQTVMSRIITTPVTAAPDFSTSITLKEGQVVMTGQVPDEESRSLLLTLARAQFGNSAVVDNLSVSPGAPDDWRQVISAVLMNLAGFKEVAAAISPGKLMLDGVARDRQTADMVRDHVNGSLPKSIRPELSIRTPEVPAPDSEETKSEDTVSKPDEGKLGELRSADPRDEQAVEAETVLAAAVPAADAPESLKESMADESPVEQQEVAGTETSASLDPPKAPAESPANTDSGEKRPFEQLADEATGTDAAGDTTAQTAPEQEPPIEGEAVADETASTAAEKTGAEESMAVTAAETVPEAEPRHAAETTATAGQTAEDPAPPTQVDTPEVGQPAAPAIDEPVTETRLEPSEAPVADETTTAEPMSADAGEPILVDTGEDDEAEKSRCLASINAMLAGKRINFHFDSTYVHTKHNGMLDKIVAVAILCPEVLIQVEGHTDSIGPAAYNQHLSERRASSGASALNKRGIWQEQLTSIGYGETRPIASNRTKTGRAKNRRIEFKVKETQP